MIPTMETINYLQQNADLRKTTGYDYIPYMALMYPKFREIVFRDLTNILQNKEETRQFFEAKLTLFNKNKDGKPPTTDQLRLIACTCIL